MTTLSNPTSIDGHHGAITPEQIESCRAQFADHPMMKLLQNAVTNGELNEVALDREVVTSTDFTFSTLLDEWEVTSQKQSGRCWMFAAMNLFRVGAMKKMNLSNFEFSQNYMFFWDKFERANYFLRTDHRHRRTGTSRRPDGRLHARRSDSMTVASGTCS